MDPSKSTPAKNSSAGEAHISLPPRSEIGDSREVGNTSATEVLGEYELIEKLGAGGMGTVWRAQRQGGGRQVALKLLNSSHLASEIAKRRFQREVEVASLLEHPNIARVYESGVDHGSYFYTMERIDGLTLDEYAEQHHLDQRSLLSLIKVVCRAMQYAHQKGVIHRDLKPSNILVDDNNNPHIVDFGLGKLLDEMAPLSTISVQGDWAGTPSYMSPEQAAGFSDQVDTRGDIYCLGVILYQLITKRLPHDAAGGNLAVLDRVAHAEIIRPRIAMPGMDRDLEALLLKSLAKRPEDRYASVGEMADDIENFLKGEPLKARRATPAYFLRKKFAKHRFSIIAASIVIASLAGILVDASIRVTQERNRAVAESAIAQYSQHLSQLSLADMTLMQADSLARESHWNQAADGYWNAYQIEIAEGASTLNSTLGSLEAMRTAPMELTHFREPAPTVGMLFEPKELSVLTEMAIGMTEPFDLLTGLPGTMTGQQVSTGQIIDTVDSPDKRYVYRLHGWGRQGAPICEIEKADLQTGSVQTLFQFKGQFSYHTMVSPDGNNVVADAQVIPSNPAIFNLWLLDAASRTTPQSLTTHNAAIRAISRSPDRRTVVVGDVQGHICFWDTVARRETHPLDSLHGLPGPLGSQAISCLKYAPDGSGIMVGDANGNLGFVSLSGARQSRIFQPSDNKVTAIEFSHDGNSVIAGDDKGNLRLWNADSGELRRVFHAESEILSAQFSSDDRMILAYTKDGSGHVWPLDLADQSVLRQCQGPIQCMALSPDNLIAAVGTSNNLDIIDIATGHRIGSTVLSGNAKSVAISSSGSTLDVATDDGAISRFEIYGQWQRIAYCPPGTTLPETAAGPRQALGGRWFTILLSAASDIAVALSDKEAIVIDIAEEKRIGMIDGHYYPIGYISQDGRKVWASVGRPLPALTIIDVPTRSVSVIRLPRPFVYAVQAIAVSPDLTTAFLACGDQSVHVFDLTSRTEKPPLHIGGQNLNFLRISPDGASILSSGIDGALRLWRTSDGTQIRRIANGLGAGPIAAFSQRGDLILCSRPNDNAICICVR